MLGWQNKYLVHGEELSLYNDEYFIFRGKRFLTVDLRKRSFPISSYGRVRLRIAFLVGLTLELNFLELVDFLLGFGNVDILEDDWNAYYTNLSKKEK
ncbi:hypothetical protein LEP1GSC050_2801 [Leptospira broomii serovar Hurstbridge str. 5399]|uniref:Uncharacterized protein n=1 Tax=Leptospira broomii serovar Hurstbridge str. 5399 TaxID=1049789 RepID=T0GAJ4_9LEPT|nr:hypothetical protein LEP1GSC050_2801 [Leptospira broomii serovar Hurstbridge str. 5399]